MPVSDPARSSRLWALIRSTADVRLVLLRIRRPAGKLLIPGAGTVAWSVERAVSFDPVDSAASSEVSLYEDGDVLIRAQDGAYAPAPSKSCALLRVLSALCLIVLFRAGSSLLPAPGSDAWVAPHAGFALAATELPPGPSGPAPLEVPSPKPEAQARVEHLEMPKKSSPPPKEVSKNPGSEKAWAILRKAREAMVRGDPSGARRLGAEAERSFERGQPEELISLMAELDWALCRRFVMESRWRDAVKACEGAFGRNGHQRAGEELVNLAARAKLLYLEGYVMEKTDPKAAAARYRKAVEAAPTGDPFGRKAAERLAPSPRVR